MIIRIIPETAEEKKNLEKLEWRNVQDYMVFGVHEDEDGHFIDFHSWRGRHQFLIGNLQFFYEQVNGERAFRQQKELEAKFRPNLMPKINVQKPIDLEEVNVRTEKDKKDTILPQAGFELVTPTEPTEPTEEAPDGE